MRIAELAMKRMVTDEELEKALEALEPGETTSVIDYDRDPDIQGAIIGQRELIIEGTTLSQAQRGDINEVTNATLLKLGAVRHHAEAFRRYQEQKYEELLRDERKLRFVPRGAIFAERELMYEFDAFMHQLKSSLDMLVKVLGVVFDNNPRSPQTYGDAGEGVIKYLRKQKNHYDRQGQLNETLARRIDRVVQLVGSARAPWLKPLIDWRDTVSHYTSLTTGFTWDSKEDKLQVPVAIISGNERPLLDVLEGQLITLMEYSAEFLGRSLSCAFPSDVELSPLTEDKKQTINESSGLELTYARYEAVRTTAKVSIKVDGREVF